MVFNSFHNIFFHGTISLYHHVGHNNSAISTCTLSVYSRTGIVGSKITLIACMFVCSVSVFVLSCVDANLAICKSSYHWPSMQSYQMPVGKIYKPCKQEDFGYSKTETSCRYANTKKASVPQYFSRYEDILFLIQYVRTTAWLLYIQGTIRNFLEQYLKCQKYITKSADRWLSHVWSATYYFIVLGKFFHNLNKNQYQINKIQRLFLLC